LEHTPWLTRWIGDEIGRLAAHPTKPVSLHVEPEIPRKQKAFVTNEAANGEVNGIMTVPNGVVGKRKRSADEAELENGAQRSKRLAKMPEAADHDGPHLISLDDDSGAILIDDD
jgi:ubiquitin-like 1-activating enzyme E1 B